MLLRKLFKYQETIVLVLSITVTESGKELVHYTDILTEDKDFIISIPIDKFKENSVEITKEELKQLINLNTIENESI